MSFTLQWRIQVGVHWVWTNPPSVPDYYSQTNSCNFQANYSQGQSWYFAVGFLKLPNSGIKTHPLPGWPVVSWTSSCSGKYCTYFPYFSSAHRVCMRAYRLVHKTSMHMISVCGVKTIFGVCQWVEPYTRMWTLGVANPCLPDPPLHLCSRIPERGVLGRKDQEERVPVRRDQVGRVPKRT